LRTFLVERVSGDMLDMDTGELLPAEKWASVLYDKTGGGEFNRQSKTIKIPIEHKEAIHFTGFPAAVRDELEGLAEKNGLHVASSVVKDLRYIVVGKNASAKKVADARTKHAEVMDKDMFMAMIYGEENDFL
jgi:NAD-dependent DNA ligase